MLEHRCCDGAICVIFKVHCNPDHSLEAELPRVCEPARLSRLAVPVHSRYLDVPRSRRVQFSSSFVLRVFKNF